MESVDHRDFLLNVIDFSLGEEWDERLVIITLAWKKQNMSMEKKTSSALISPHRLM